MKKIKFIIGIIIVIVLSFLYAHIAKVNAIYDRNVDNSEYMSTGVFSDSAEQTFISKEETLDGITVKCQALGDARGSSVSLKLFDKTTGELVAESELKAEELENSKFNTFNFDTVEECKGKEYLAIFESHGENVEETKGISIFYQPTTEKDTVLEINDSNVDGTLIMKTVTNRFDMETFCVILLFACYIFGFLKFLYKLFK